MQALTVATCLSSFVRKLNKVNRMTVTKGPVAEIQNSFLYLLDWVFICDDWLGEPVDIAEARSRHGVFRAKQKPHSRRLRFVWQRANRI